MCLFRWRGVTVAPESTVTRDSARCPCTVVPRMPGPSKRTSFRASVFETYTFPDTGFTAMLKSTVPTCAQLDVGTGGFAFALIANTSRSGSEKRTALFQLRLSSSCHWFAPGLNLTIRPTSGPRVFCWLRLGAGSPPG